LRRQAVHVVPTLGGTAKSGAGLARPNDGLHKMTPPSNTMHSSRVKSVSVTPQA
jgi:hypothetical protein